MCNDVKWVHKKPLKIHLKSQIILHNKINKNHKNIQKYVKPYKCIEILNNLIPIAIINMKYS